jgi:hypothetical protein
MGSECETRLTFAARLPVGSAPVTIRQLQVKGLKKSRKGKHHDLMGKIMEDLRKSEPGFAVQIPLDTTNHVSVLSLRSAIVRAAAKENIKVMTSSDDRYFYAWKKDDTTR